MQNKFENQIGNSKQKTEKEKKRNQKKIKETSRWIKVHQQSPVASPSGAWPGYRFGIRPTGGTHTVEKVIFFLSTCVRSTRR
jgi:hypothetical protein